MKITIQRTSALSVILAIFGAAMLACPSLAAEAPVTTKPAKAAAVISQPVAVPSWSKPILEDWKGNRLNFVATPEFWAKGTKTFFGDVHVHSNYSQCGWPNNMNLPDKLAYARDVLKLDFVAPGDHIEHMNDDQYAQYCKEVNAANEPGKFVTLASYEWKVIQHIAVQGHRIVYFRDDFGPAFRGTDEATATPKRLNATLKNYGKPVMAPRHHPTYLNNWNTFDPVMEPVTEIMSSNGSSEREGGPLQQSFDGRRFPLPGNYIQDGLIRGNLMGFIGGSDGHNLMPASNGLTGVIAPELTREAIWDAIHNRRCYATTGKKILVDFSVNGFPMGTVLRCSGQKWADLFPLKITGAAIGTAALDKIELIENNRVIYTQTARLSPDTDMAFAFQIEKQVPIYWRYYYIRVTQNDGHMAWSSPIWLLFSDEDQ